MKTFDDTSLSLDLSEPEQSRKENNPVLRPSSLAP